MLGYVYILQSEKNSQYYIGSSNNPNRRLDQHNSNAVVATRHKGPWVIKKTVEFKDETVARKAEAYLKKQKSRKIIELIIEDKYNWPESFQIAGRAPR